MSAPVQPSINEASAPLVAALLRDARMLRLGVSRDVSGAVLVDAGIAARGKPAVPSAQAASRRAAASPRSVSVASDG